MLHSSPFAHVLGTSSVPSNDEIPLIEALTQNPLQEISCLDDKMEELVLMVAIKKYRKQREELSKYVKANKALTSLSRRLPVDILAEIFFQCLPKSHNAVCSRRKPPLLFGQVCKSWREVSLTTPKLCSAIHIAVPTSMDPTTYNKIIQERCNGIMAWLDRSIVLPLSISLCPAMSFSSADYACDTRDILDAVINFSHR